MPFAIYGETDGNDTTFLAKSDYFPEKVDTENGRLFYIGVDSNHWTCQVIDFPTKIIKRMDSEHTVIPDSNKKKIIHAILQGLEEKYGVEKDGWTFEDDPDVPQQLKSHECGEFSLSCMESALRGKTIASLINPQNTAPYRRKIATALHDINGQALLENFTKTDGGINDLLQVLKLRNLGRRHERNIHLFTKQVKDIEDSPTDESYRMEDLEKRIIFHRNQFLQLQNEAELKANPTPY